VAEGHPPLPFHITSIILLGYVDCLLPLWELGSVCNGYTACPGVQHHSHGHVTDPDPRPIYRLDQQQQTPFNDVLEHAPSEFCVAQRPHLASERG